MDDDRAIARAYALWMRVWLRPTIAVAERAGLGALPVAPPAWVAAEA